MATGVISPAITFQGYTGNGALNAGGFVATYAAGTTTPIATYTDATLTTPNSNPVRLNAIGQAAIWLTPGVTYKFVETDALGNQCGYADQLQGPAPQLTQQGIGALLYPQTAAEITAGVTPTYYRYPVGNVLRYGADNTGLVDSTTILQSAINVMAATNGGIVYFPQGTYKVTSTLKITTSDIQLLGAGAGSFHYVSPNPNASTIFNWAGGATPVVQYDPQYPTNNQWLANCQFDGIYINGNGLATVAAQINSCRNGRFRVFANDCTTNIVQISSTLPGSTLSDTSDTQQNYIEVEGTQTQANAPNGGLLYLDGQLFTFQGYASGSTTLHVTNIAAGNYLPIGSVLLIGSGASATTSGVTIASYGTGSGGNVGTYILSGALTTAGAPTPVTLSITNANTSDNTVGLVDGNVYNGSAITFANCDNNVVNQLRCYISGPTGRALTFLAGAYNGSARQNFIIHASPASAGVTTFTGTITGTTTLTTSSVTGILQIGQVISGGTIGLNCMITAGSGSSWTISPAQTNQGPIPMTALTPMILSQGTESGAQSSYGNYILFFDPTEGGAIQPQFGVTATLNFAFANAAFPAVRATTRNNTSQSISSSTPVTIYWDNISGNYDLTNNFSNGTTFTAPKPGVYDVSVTLTSSSAMVAGDRYQLDIIVVGGFGQTESTQSVCAASSIPQTFQARAKMRMAAQDTLIVQISRQGGTGTFAPSASDTNNRLEINYVSQAF